MSGASGRHVRRYEADQMFITITAKGMNLDGSLDVTTAVILDLPSNYR